MLIREIAKQYNMTEDEMKSLISEDVYKRQLYTIFLW